MKTRVSRLRAAVVVYRKRETLVCGMKCVNLYRQWFLLSLTGRDRETEKKRELYTLCQRWRNVDVYLHRNRLEIEDFLTKRERKTKRERQRETESYTCCVNIDALSMFFVLHRNRLDIEDIWWEKDIIFSKECLFIEIHLSDASVSSVFASLAHTFNSYCQWFLLFLIGRDRERQRDREKERDVHVVSTLTQCWCLFAYKQT